jgi:hypothetical protein
MTFHKSCVPNHFYFESPITNAPDKSKNFSDEHGSGFTPFLGNKQQLQLEPPLQLRKRGMVSSIVTTVDSTTTLNVHKNLQ